MKKILRILAAFMLLFSALYMLVGCTAYDKYDTSLENVVFDIEAETITLRFRKNGSGILMSSFDITFDEESRIFTLPDKREIKLTSDTDATVDGEEYTYYMSELNNSNVNIIQYVFTCKSDGKILRVQIYEGMEPSMIVQIPFTYKKTDDKLSISLEGKFYGKKIKTYTAKYEIVDNREIILDGNTLNYYPYDDDRSDFCPLYPDDYSQNLYLYPNGKGSWGFSVDVTANDTFDSFVLTHENKNINITLIAEKRAVIDGVAYNYTVSKDHNSEFYEFYSTDSPIEYTMFKLNFEDESGNDHTVSADIEYPFTYEFDGTTVDMDFGNLREKAQASYNSETNSVIFDGIEFFAVGDMVSPNKK